MIVFPFKRIFGLIGVPRSGKDSVSNFLQETREFVPLAFADRIKKEFGVSKEDFEAAKISGNIKELRDKLWAYSAEKTKDDPEYFIRLVMEQAANTKKSVIITDIRTEDEFNALFKYAPAENLPRIYHISSGDTNEFSGDCLVESKISRGFLLQNSGNIRFILNNKKESGLYAFYQALEHYFMVEDIMDLPEAQDDYDKQTIYNKHKYNSMVSSYMAQFEVRQR